MNHQTSNQISRNIAKVLYKTTVVEGLSIFYREAGDSGNPKILLLHGFPASSHQYRNLVSVLSERFHLIAPDYPGFGNSDMPSPDKFDYTFDRLSEITESFLKKIAFTCMCICVLLYFFTSSNYSLKVSLPSLKVLTQVAHGGFGFCMFLDEYFT